ncbi:hypothetical protein FJZ28_01745 [Candidatus Peregrinibacteria bacterium]|nr:hypothetical protein [Candidatus Peregrinibacteria bacterium]
MNNVPTTQPEQQENPNPVEAKLEQQLTSENVDKSLNALKAEAADKQDAAGTALKNKIQTIANKVLSAAEGDITAAANAIVNKLGGKGITAHINNGQIIVDAIGAAPAAAAAKPAAAPELGKFDKLDSDQKAILEKIDMTPNEQQDIDRALSSMSDTDIKELVSVCKTFVEQVGQDLSKVVAAYNASKQPNADADAIMQTLPEGAQHALRTLNSNPVMEKFFDALPARGPAAGPNKQKSNGEDIGDAFKKLLDAFEKLAKFFEDFNAMRSKGKIPRVSDAGINDDIVKGRHFDHHMNATKTALAEVNSELKSIGTDADPNSSIGKLIAQSKLPAASQTDKQNLDQQIQEMRQRRTELIKDKQKLDKRMQLLKDNEPPDHKEKREKADRDAAEQKKQLLEGGASKVNNLPLNDIAKAEVSGDTLKLTPKTGGRFSSDIAKKLEAAGAKKVDNTYILENPTKESADAVTNVIRDAAIANIDKSNSIWNTDKDGIRGALQKSGDWHGPETFSNGLQIDYIQAPNGKFYAQSTTGKTTYEFNGKEFVELKDQCFDGASKTLKPRVDGQVYDKEKRTFKTPTAEEKKATKQKQEADIKEIQNRRQNDDAKQKIKFATNATSTDKDGVFTFDVATWPNDDLDVRFNPSLDDGKGAWEWSEAGDNDWHPPTAEEVDKSWSNYPEVKKIAAAMRELNKLT